MPSPSASAGRDARIDALKGVAIVCVVLYHTLGQYFITAPTLALWVRELLFAFMLPLFAFLSGYVQPRLGALKPAPYFTRRTLGLLVPYVCWEAIYGLTLGNVARSGAAPLAGYLLGVFGNPHLEGRMWYLYVLWAALMVLGVVRLLGRDNPWWLVLSIVGVMLWPWWGEFKRLQWIYTYVVLGLLARRHEARLRRHARVIGAAGAVAFVPLWLMTRPEQIAVARVSGWLDGSPLAGAGVASLYGLSTITGIAAIAAIVAASYSARQPVLGVLALPGKLSLGIYVVHFYFVEAWHDPSPLWIPVIVAIALTGSMVVTLLLARWRVSATLLLGERWTSKSRPLGDVKTETL